MKTALKGLFWTILAVMAVATTIASLERSVFANGHLMRDPWFVATLADAYCGFLTFYAWVFYKERAAWARAAWFVAVMALGNFAMATYVLLQLSKLQPDEPLDRLLIRRG